MDRDEMPAMPSSRAQKARNGRTVSPSARGNCGNFGRGKRIDAFPKAPIMMIDAEPVGTIAMEVTGGPSVRVVRL